MVILWNDAQARGHVALRTHDDWQISALSLVSSDLQWFTAWDFKPSTYSYQASVFGLPSLYSWVCYQNYAHVFWTKSLIFRGGESRKRFICLSFFGGTTCYSSLVAFEKLRPTFCDETAWSRTRYEFYILIKYVHVLGTKLDTLCECNY